MTKEDIMKYLEEVFGIKTERDLIAAMATAEMMNVGIMTKGVVADDKPTRT